MPDRVLVVDDDRGVVRLLEKFLSRNGLAVVTAGSGRQMAQILQEGPVDLVVLDVGLPDGDGFELTRELRRRTRIPIILLTGRDDVFDRVLGLELGADDYVAKPFEPRELLARIRSVLRRAQPPEEPGSLPRADRLRFAGFVADLRARRLRDRRGNEVPLTSTEFSLLRVLAERAGEVVSRERIMQAIHGTAFRTTDRAVDAHVVRLRRKLAESYGDEELIKTVHGLGYTLAAAVERE